MGIIWQITYESPNMVKAKYLRNAALLCIALSAILCFSPFFDACKEFERAIIAISSTLATLAGAMLVYSTLELQRQAFEEEKKRNNSAQFASRFYPLLSNFRSDAASLIIRQQILTSKGKTNITDSGEKAFRLARQILEALLKGIKANNLKDYNEEDYEIEANNFSYKLNSIDEYDPNRDQILDATEKEQKEFIKSQQIPFLLYQYDISEAQKHQWESKTDEEKKTLLLTKMEEMQQPIFAKYIRTLRFILYLIAHINDATEKNVYYQHLYCLLGKEELEFVKCFKEFNPSYRIPASQIR